MSRALQNKIVPYEAKGTWYHFFIESDGSTYTLTTSDLDDTIISSSALKYPKGFVPVDFKMAVHNTAVSAATINMSLKIFSNEQQGNTIPGAATFDYMDAWVFGYFA